MCSKPYASVVASMHLTWCPPLWLSVCSCKLSRWRRDVVYRVCQTVRGTLRRGSRNYRYWIIVSLTFASSFCRQVMSVIQMLDMHLSCVGTHVIVMWLSGEGEGANGASELHDCREAQTGGHHMSPEEWGDGVSHLRLWGHGAIGEREGDCRKYTLYHSQ